jgi:hypothetical protein
MHKTESAVLFHFIIFVYSQRRGAGMWWALGTNEGTFAVSHSPKLLFTSSHEELTMKIIPRFLLIIAVATSISPPSYPTRELAKKGVYPSCETHG